MSLELILGCSLRTHTLLTNHNLWSM